MYILSLKFTTCMMEVYNLCDGSLQLVWWKFTTSMMEVYNLCDGSLQLLW